LHDDIFKIMPEVREAASKIHYGSQTEIMANIVQKKLAPKQSRGMRRSVGFGQDLRQKRAVERTTHTSDAPTRKW
jgi:hypothetical protein